MNFPCIIDVKMIKRVFPFLVRLCGKAEQSGNDWVSKAMSARISTMKSRAANSTFPQCTAGRNPFHHVTHVDVLSLLTTVCGAEFALCRKVSNVDACIPMESY